MGGFVARTMLSLPNHQSKSINTIISMATPHLAPPVSLEYELTNLYKQTNDFWRSQFSHQNLANGSNIFLLLLLFFIN